MRRKKRNRGVAREEYTTKQLLYMLLRPSTLKVLFALAERDLSFTQICHLVFAGNASSSTISRALKCLVGLGLVEVEESLGPINAPRKFYKLKERYKAKVKKLAEASREYGELLEEFIKLLLNELSRPSGG